MNSPGKIDDHRAHFLIQWFDILFIMALCFVVLLGTMLARGKVLVGAGGEGKLDYSVGFWSILVVFVVFAVYLWYVLAHSEKELAEMVNHVHGEPAKPSPPDRKESAR